MEAKTAMTVEEYLHTAFDGLDKEYRDGEIVERSLPDKWHGRVQAFLAAFFVAASKSIPLWVYSDTRVRIRPRVFLIPDVMVYYLADDPDAVPTTPPFIAIEILSPDDRMSEVRAKLEEYRAWGVAHVCLVDPRQRRMYTCDGAFIEVPTLRIPELGLEVMPADAFGS